MLDNKLIKNALALTGKTMEDMEIVSGVIYQKEELTYKFSIEKFYAFLLSPEFIEKYTYEIRKELRGYITDRQRWQAQHFGNAIYEYQSGNEKPLIELLSKIGAK